MGRLGDARLGAFALVPVQHLGDQQQLRALLFAVGHPEGQGLGLLGTVKGGQIRRQILAGNEGILAFGAADQHFAQFHVQSRQHIGGNAALIFRDAAHNELAGVGGLGKGRHGDFVGGGNGARHLGRAARPPGAGNGQDQAKQNQQRYMQASTH